MAIYGHQTGTIKDTETDQFYMDVVRGLTSTPKYLQSKYFYDAVGDQLFQQIMHSPEYYLFRSELEIFSEQTEELANTLLANHQDVDIVELGAGDATKSTHLLKYLKENGNHFTYYPVDISKNVIQLLEREMPKRIPGLNVHGLNGDYFEMLHQSYEVSSRRKIVLFMGSNIGNFTPKEAQHFLKSLHKSLLPGDLLLIGFDLKKHPAQILAAYNDKGEITKQFNLNILTRINQQLDADFNVHAFDHFPVYDPVTGACKSYLVSTKQQLVHIGNTTTVELDKNEPIYMELSQKYTVAETDELAESTGFAPKQYFFDSEKWFLDVVWEVK